MVNINDRSRKNSTQKWVLATTKPTFQTNHQRVPCLICNSNAIEIFIGFLNGNKTCHLEHTWVSWHMSNSDYFVFSIQYWCVCRGIIRWFGFFRFAKALILFPRLINVEKIYLYSRHTNINIVVHKRNKSYDI